MKKIIGLIILAITYIIMLGSVILGRNYGAYGILKLLIIIIISIIDIITPIISKLVFGVENKKGIGFPKLILNIFIIIMTIVWWRDIKSEYFTGINFICEVFITICITLRVLLVIIELFMLIPKKTNKDNSIEKNKNPAINPIIQLVGYIILEIAILTETYLAFIMPIIILIVDIIMFLTNKKIINLIKLMISIIMIFTIFIGLELYSDFYEPFRFIIFEGVLQIILNIIEIINVSPILRRNKRKVLIIILGIIILCIICVKVSIVNLKYDIYQKEVDYPYSRYIREYRNNIIIITSKEEFDNFIENKLNLGEEIIYESYSDFYYRGNRLSKSEIYKKFPEVKKAINELKLYKQNVELELGIDEQFFDKYNVIYGISSLDRSNVTSVRYNRIKDKIFVNFKVISTGNDVSYETFIKVDKKYDAQVEWKELSNLFSR